MVSHTASTTIVVSILDIDNRPPWFQPCTETAIDKSTICLMSGYNGNVNLNEQAVGFLSKALVDRGLMLSQTILNVI